MVAGDFFTSSACGPTNLIEPSVYYGSVDGILMNLQTWGHGSWWVHLRSLDHYHYLLWWHDRAASGPWNRGFSTSINYGDVIRSAMASQITGLSIVYSAGCLGATKKISKLRATGLGEGNLSVTGEFLAQRASNAENVSIWWRHHVSTLLVLVLFKSVILK